MKLSLYEFIEERLICADVLLMYNSYVYVILYHSFTTICYPQNIYIVTL